ncbi:MAG: phytase [Deltaproteobacteria bacterium]|nr:phytase [Deltaproteobacteria bacterium]
MAEKSLFRIAVPGSVPWLRTGLLLLLGGTTASGAGIDLPAMPPNPVVAPVLVSERSRYDTDDPAIWFNAEHPEKSLILGTDKHRNGALYVYDLEGKIIEEKVVRHLRKPNNVDVEYGFSLGGEKIDIAVVTEVITEKLRIYRLPEMTAIDNGGIRVFRGEPSHDFRSPMGIALYRRPEDGAVFAIVSRKKGPAEGYLWQYRLEEDGHGGVRGVLARKFGAFSGGKGIEAVAVDDALGFVYYSDERNCIRKYHADPFKGAGELARFGEREFVSEREGIAIYPLDAKRGYLVISDQQGNRFHIYRREGEQNQPHRHQLLKTVYTTARRTDGCEVIPQGLNGKFPHGLFVAMSNDRTFQFFNWPDLMGEDQIPASRPDGPALAKAQERDESLQRP